jgi:LysM repeat protein
MPPRRLILLFVLLGGGWSFSLAEEGYDEQASRHATAMEWSNLTQGAEQAIRAWLLENRGEEWIEGRRYYGFGETGPNRDKRYLLVITGLKPARGNFSVTDFVVLRKDPIAKPIIHEFGDVTDRYIDAVELKEDGIQVDYYRRELGAFRPNIPARSLFKFSGDKLEEVIVQMPDEKVSAMELKRAAEEKARILEEEARQQREKSEAALRIMGPDGKYTIRAGDTASKIARAFGLRFDQLSILNPNVDWAKMEIGQVLKVRPDATNGL